MNETVKLYKLFKMLEEFGYAAESIELRSKSGDVTVLHKPAVKSTGGMNVFADEFEQLNALSALEHMVVSSKKSSRYTEGPYGNGNDRSDR